MREQLTPNLQIKIPKTPRGEAARSLALTMSNEQLREWCNQINQRDFNQPFQPDEKHPWLDGSRKGMINFIVCSFF